MTSTNRTSTHRTHDSSHDASLAEAARTAPHGGFKRLALPAVAAAVHTLAQAKPRPQKHQDWPALLRQDRKPN